MSPRAVSPGTPIRIPEGNPNLTNVSTIASSPAYSIKGRWKAEVYRPGLDGPGGILDMSKMTYVSSKRARITGAKFSMASRFPGTSKYAGRTAEVGTYFKEKIPTYMGNDSSAVAWAKHDTEEQARKSREGKLRYPPVYDTRNNTVKFHHTYREQLCPAFTKRHHVFNDVPAHRMKEPGFDKYTPNHKALIGAVPLGIVPKEKRSGFPVKEPRPGDPTTGPGKYPIPSTFHQSADKLSDCRFKRSARYTLAGAPWRTDAKRREPSPEAATTIDAPFNGASTIFGWRK
ncbi:unnamed protein product [Amoebophrya sp. A25]|nr:unnamed protein product [Amoebophrya sp. A25]|eukprot:GSA25T00013814001.1